MATIDRTRIDEELEKKVALLSNDPFYCGFGSKKVLYFSEELRTNDIVEECAENHKENCGSIPLRNRIKGLEDKIEGMKDTMIDMEGTIVEIKDAISSINQALTDILYAPNGPMYQEAKSNFDRIKNW